MAPAQKLFGGDGCGGYRLWRGSAGWPEERISKHRRTAFHANEAHHVNGLAVHELGLLAGLGTDSARCIGEAKRRAWPLESGASGHMHTVSQQRRHVPLQQRIDGEGAQRERIGRGRLQDSNRCAPGTVEINADHLPAGDVE